MLRTSACVMLEFFSYRPKGPQRDLPILLRLQPPRPHHPPRRSRRECDRRQRGHRDDPLPPPDSRSAPRGRGQGAGDLDDRPAPRGRRGVNDDPAGALVRLLRPPPGGGRRWLSSPSPPRASTTTSPSPSTTRTPTPSLPRTRRP